jgi:hypothetical protein
LDLGPTGMRHDSMNCPFQVEESAEPQQRSGVEGDRAPALASRILSRRRRHVPIVERFSEVKDSDGDTPLAADGASVCDSGTVRWSASA